MYDIYFQNCSKQQIEFIKAYFIVNNRVFQEDQNGICFYTNQIDDLFNLIQNLNTFFDQHTYAQHHVSAPVFVIEIGEDGRYILNNRDDWR